MNFKENLCLVVKGLENECHDLIKAIKDTLLSLSALDEDLFQL